MSICILYSTKYERIIKNLFLEEGKGKRSRNHDFYRILFLDRRSYFLFEMSIRTGLY